MKERRNGFSIYEQKDAYYDGLSNEYEKFYSENEIFDEATGRIIDVDTHDLWGFDSIKELERKKYKEYIE